MKLSDTNGSPLADISSYRRLIVRLIYLTTTRPDISYIVNQLNQFLSSLTTIHQQAAIRLLKYIKGTPGLGLLFPTNSDMKLKAYSDSDWARCPDTRRSVIGFNVCLGNALISWKLKKQNTVLRSSCEAEYRALADTTCEMQWLTYLLHDLNIPTLGPALIYCDNNSAIHIARKPILP